MKLIEAINAADRLKPNMYEMPDKIKWLSRLDTRIFQEVLLTHVLSEEEKAPFLPETDSDQGPDITPGLPGPEQEAEQALDLQHGFCRRPEEQLVFAGYGPEDGEKELIVGEPFDEMYVLWISAQIDWNNMEYESFNNSNAMFESVLLDFKNAFNRTHRPKGAQRRYY